MVVDCYGAETPLNQVASVKTTRYVPAISIFVRIRFGHPFSDERQSFGEYFYVSLVVQRSIQVPLTDRGNTNFFVGFASARCRKRFIGAPDDS